MGLRCADEIVRAMIDALPAAVAYLDARGYYREHNLEFARGWCGGSDVRGRHVRDVLGPAAYEVVRPHLERALAGETLTTEARLPTLDGRDPWVQAHYVPHAGPDGTVRGVITLGYDISERKRVEARLHTLASAGARMASKLDDGDSFAALARCAVPEFAEWCVVYVEAAGGTLDPVQIVCAEHVPEARLRRVVERYRPQVGRQGDPIAECARTGAARLLEGLDLHTSAGAAADASELEAMRALAPRAALLAPLVVHGRTLGVLVLGSSLPRRWAAEDLTVAEELGRRAGVALENARLFAEERLAHERLREAIRRQEAADRRKDEFLALLGHELRNPLAPIVTALQLLDLRGQLRGVRELQVIRRQTEHLTRLVDDLLDVSRVVRGRLELRAERLEIAEAVSRAVEIASPLLEARAHVLAIEVAREGLMVVGDVFRLAQVFANLLTNAAKYMDRGGRARIAATRADDTVLVVVEDDGAGISADLLPRIFEPFVQGPRSLDRSYGGLGLGLALVKHLVELHGGTVSVHSEGSGRGSRFSVRLPLAAAIEEPVLCVRDPARVGAIPSPVLVVDDNPDVAEMLAMALRDEGIEVATAYDPATALTLAAERFPRAAVLDLGLPVLDGYELAGLLRARAVGRPLRLVALSGYGDDVDRRRSAAAGFAAHLVKPVDLHTVIAALGAEEGEDT